MTTSITQPADQPMNETDNNKEAPAVQSATPQLSGSHPKLPEEVSNSQSFYFEGEQSDPEALFVAPFQLSGAMPPAFGSAQASGQVSPAPPAPSTPSAKTRRRLRLSLPMIAILVCVVVILGLLAMNALAQPMQPLQTPGAGSSQTTQPTRVKGNQQPVVKAPSPAPTSRTNEQAPGQITPSWVPQSLPNGWTNVGLSTGDAVQTLRTATTFTDREMSLDYRSVGTRAHHAGSFTAAVFLLTPAAQQRFQTNDVRASDNRLFDMVVRAKLIRLVINPLPKLIKFAAQGRQQFAWVDVQFLLWQSQIDLQTGHIQQGVQLDPATNQPRVHHLMVLLLRVSPQNAGTNPAMGGTGWLVSNYGLDLPNGADLDIVQPA